MKFICSSCGYESSKWMGRCPDCQNWNTFEEMKVIPKGKAKKALAQASPLKIADVTSLSKSRLTTGFEEFDRVLGGGIIAGEMILLSGDPGIGKSTLLLQIALNMSRNKVVLSNSKEAAKDPISKSLNKNNNQEILLPLPPGRDRNQNDNNVVLYVTGEESEDQVKVRAERIVDDKTLSKSNLFIVSTTNIDSVCALLEDQSPTLVIIDSIQTMESEEVSSFPGSIPQIRHATGRLVEVAKRRHIPIILVGHVTKEGIVAGPMLLSHMVDAVLYLEGEKLSGTRILRAFKNRFGDVSEVGIFLMEEKGLVELQNASEYFMDRKNQNTPGSVASIIMEGSRPLIIEVQALTVPSSLSFPRRVVSGLSEKRVELLLAVIQKHVKIPLERLDVFVNVVGGFKVIETASDLAVCMAVVSSFKNKAAFSTAAISEVGLLGELRSVVNLDKRVKEAGKFGFKTIVSAKTHKSLFEVMREV